MSFPDGLHTVSAARRFLAATMRGWGTDDYDFGAPQVLSELATNAALHARSPFTVTLRLDQGSLYLAVTDGSPRPPRQRHYSLDATTGRGVGLVAALSHDWGTAFDGNGKTVWARVAPDGSGLGNHDSSEWADVLGDTGAGGDRPTAGNVSGVRVMAAA